VANSSISGLITSIKEKGVRYIAVTVFNVIVGAIAVYAMLRTLRLREILGRAKAARESEQAN